jgi:prevent-host-death family protein
MTTTVGLGEFRRRPGHYLRLVEAGGCVVLTRRNRPVAELTPVTTEHLHPLEPQRPRDPIGVGWIVEPLALNNPEGIIHALRAMRDEP